MTAIATPLPPPEGGQENVPRSLVRMLRENREVLGAEWTDLAIRFVEERTAFGRRKYGQELHTFDGRPPHLDALQELVDLMQYLHKSELEHEQLVAENAGLRAKVAVLEGELERARAAPPVLPPPVPDADEGDQPPPAAATDDERSPCDDVPDAECQKRTCTECPVWPGAHRGRRA